MRKLLTFSSIVISTLCFFAAMFLFSLYAAQEAFAAGSSPASYFDYGVYDTEPDDAAWNADAGAGVYIWGLKDGVDANGSVVLPNDIDGTPVVYADMRHSKIDSLDARQCQSLVYLNCEKAFNQGGELLVSGCSSLEFLDCYMNWLEDLDLTGCDSLAHLECRGNCLDEEEVSAIRSMMQERGMTGAEEPQMTSIENAVVHLQSATYDGYTWNGELTDLGFVEPTAMVAVCDGKAIYQDQDFYIMGGGKCIYPGTYEFRVVGWNYYFGEAAQKAKFVISKAPMKEKSIKLAYTKTVYNGLRKTPAPIVLVYSTSRSGFVGPVEEPAANYKTTYWNKAKTKQVAPKGVGTYWVKVSSKEAANTKGSAWKKFVVNPKATANLKLVRLNNGFKASWTKRTVQCSGYQVAYKQVGTTVWKYKTVTGYKTNVKSVTGLKDKKSYQVRVRTYKTVSGVKYYSAYTPVKTVKTK